MTAAQRELIRAEDPGCLRRVWHGQRRMSRIKVIRLAPAANPPASRAAARPPGASSIARSALSNPGAAPPVPGGSRASDRRTSSWRSRHRRRRTGGPAAGSAFSRPRAQCRTIGVHTGCAPGRGPAHGGEQGRRAGRGSTVSREWQRAVRAGALILIARSGRSYLPRAGRTLRRCRLVSGGQ